MNDDKGLVWIGKIIALEDIPNADFIAQATVVCGAGGKWRGVVKKTDFQLDDLCIVYLPDSLLPDTEDFAFMAKNKFRVKMMRFKGASSEVLIMPYRGVTLIVGSDITKISGVKKYYKPVPAHLNGIAKGFFPEFLRKTDEPNWQMQGDLVHRLKGHPYYTALKADGSSTTVFRYKGSFGVCSRNLELERCQENGYWKVAGKYKLEERLPEGYAIQFETCGPGIQSNPMGLKEIDGFAFSVWDIVNRRYLEMSEFLYFCDKIDFPHCTIVEIGESFDPICVPDIAQNLTSNDRPCEGVVIRSQKNIGSYDKDHPISFKVINLDYEK